MADESDGVNEMVFGGLRVGATAALHIAERHARARERAAFELQDRMDTLARHVTRAWLEPHLDKLVEDGTLTVSMRRELAADPATEELSKLVWVANQDGHDPVQVLRTAINERDFDDARSVAQVLHYRVKTTYEAGGFVARQHETAAKRDDVEAAVVMAVADRQVAEPETPGGRATAAELAAEGLRVAAGKDATAASRHATSAEQAAGGERAAEAQHERDQVAELYDSAERRRDLAASLDGVVDAETANARVVADTHQGRPPAEAVSAVPKSPKARAARGRGGAGRESDRGVTR